MSNCEVIRGLSTIFYGDCDSSAKLSPAQKMLESDQLRDNWKTTATVDPADQQHIQSFQQKKNIEERHKTFRCKQCIYTAATKEEFWEHSRSHIKAEKLLTCPNCPFVTAIKHHLEYHLRNHYGSKPFKCEKCSYSCVNNSMLKSHLKSHSNVYQYRCANCDYATKYLHSLKIHLRRYKHEPAAVLNPDGTPNPLFIVDIHGNKRGLRQKPVKIQEESQQDTQDILQNMMSMFYSSMLVSLRQILPMEMGAPMNPDIMNCVNGINGMNGLPPNFINFMAALSCNQSFPNFPMDVSPLVSNDAMLSQQFPLNNNLPIGNFTQNGNKNNFKNVNQILVTNRNVLKYEDDNTDEKVAPLDLSKPDSSNQQKKIIANCPKATGNSRRKGKAVKLDKKIMEVEYNDE